MTILRRTAAAAGRQRGAASQAPSGPGDGYAQELPSRLIALCGISALLLASLMMRADPVIPGIWLSSRQLEGRLLAGMTVAALYFHRKRLIDGIEHELSEARPGDRLVSDLGSSGLKGLFGLTRFGGVR